MGALRDNEYESFEIEREEEEKVEARIAMEERKRGQRKWVLRRSRERNNNGRRDIEIAV